MPLYQYRCIFGHEFEQFCSVALFQSRRICHVCTQMAEQVITAPLLLKIPKEVCYDSPIDGRPITSQQARQEDLKRNNCTPYDEGMKQDYHARVKDSEAQLDKSIDVGVEEAIAKMPTAKRGKLYSELVNQGVDAHVIRQ